MIRGAGRLTTHWIPFPKELLEACRWCGHAVKAGDVHGAIGPAGDDGMVPVFCRVSMMVTAPRSMWWLDGIADDSHDIARMEGEGGPPC